MDMDTNISTNGSYESTSSTVVNDVLLTINFITLMIGTIGSIANLITFTAPQLRRKSCTFYLLCTNIFQLISTFFCIPTCIALDYFDIDLERQSLIYCKIRYYLLLTLPELATYYLLLSILDRYLVTYNDVGRRSWNQLRIAHRLAMIVFIVGFISNIHILVYYTIYNNNCQTVPGSIYTSFFAGYYLSIFVVLPHVIMLILSILTFMNMKRTKRRVAAISNTHKQSLACRFEIQILMVIILQVVVSAVFLLFRMGTYVYTLLTSGNLNKTIEDYAVENFAVRLGISLYYFSFGISFYVSTLTSKYFREILWKRIISFRRLYWH